MWERWALSGPPVDARYRPVAVTLHRQPRSVDRNGKSALQLGHGPRWKGCSVPRRHALIIEDELLIALEVEVLLSEQGFKSFDIANSPHAALACALKRLPDLITADYRIVAGTGVEAVAAIEARLGPIPVVFVSGNVEQVREEAPGRADVLVDKPISPALLAAACARAMRTAR